MKHRNMACLLLYILIIQVTPLTPSVYTFLTDSLRVTITNVSLILLYKYYGSLPMVQKTFLHEIMKILIISFGVITNINYVSMAAFDLMPDIALELLHKYPNTVCSSLKGFGMPGIFFYNTMTLIILRAYFNCYPYYLFNMNEKIMWIVHVVCNMIYFVKVNTSHYLQSRSTCNVDLIEMLRVAMKLVIDETKVKSYKNMDTLTIILVLLAPLAELLSRVILKIRSMKKKSDPSNKYRLTTDIQLSFKTNEISSEIETHLPPHQLQLESDKVDIYQETVEIVSGGCSTSKRELALRAKHWSQESSVNHFGVVSTERIKKAEKNGGKIIIVEPMEILPTISELVANAERGNQVQEGDLKIMNLTKPLNLHISGKKKSTDATIHGFLSLTAVIFVFIIIAILRKYEVMNKKMYSYISSWANLKTNKLVNALLPLHWLLRKKQPRDFASRKVKIWIDMAVESFI